MWKKPYGFVEGFMVCAGLFVAGLLIQLTSGKVSDNFLSFPQNLIIGGLIIAVALLFYIFFRKKTLFNWLCSAKLAIPIIVSMLVLVVVMGLTRQVPPTGETDNAILEKLTGFSQMTSSWVFALLMLYFLFVLLLTIFKKAGKFRWKNTGFMLNHSGLFIALFAAIFGSGDLQRLTMTAQQDIPEWRAIDRKNQIIELPLAIELKQFSIDEYPPKLMILDNITGKALPENKPENLLVEQTPIQSNLLDWQLNVSQYLPLAAEMNLGDSVKFVEYHSEGAVAAVFIHAKNRRTGEKTQGWVSCGNYMFPFVSLKLNPKESLIMSPREPRRYSSDITVYRKDNESIDARIEVNKPLSVAGWKIYQLSYDEVMGKWSRQSVFELVHDPWLPFVYTGIFMMLAGALWLFVFAPKKKEDER